ncbi:methyltransferase domain-containing protein [Kistimonas scapharcae]|uniref:Methyltransferase domain-containing protein n=1 Tax=Kistimonas scapharcae TaxID=1036133 RepID=A0ABP8V504_9GAMM
MNFYDKYCLPHLLNFCCGCKDIQGLRAEIIPDAAGRVLEVGAGSGLNFPFYRSNAVEKVWALEPSDAMRTLAQKRYQQATVDIEWLALPGEEIPLENNSMDTVILTYTLCTIPDWYCALQQIYRVLKPGGRLLFCEHGRSPVTRINQWQDRLNPLWKKLFGGCHLNRAIPDLITEGHLNIQKLETQYMPFVPKPIGFTYSGHAVKKLHHSF